MRIEILPGERRGCSSSGSTGRNRSRWSWAGQVALATVVALLVMSLAASAQEELVPPDEDSYDHYYPLHARGFVRNAFELNGLDDINLFNGNLTMSLPIGPALNPGGELSLQIALRYNSKIWARERRCTAWGCQTGGSYGEGTLLGTRYAGTGWSLDFGRISQQWSGVYLLITPDGGQHRLFMCQHGSYSACSGEQGSEYAASTYYYTRDGSNVRVAYDDVSNTWEVEHPDGRIATYSEQLDNYAASLRTLRRDFSRNRDGWYCTEVRDRWGNKITIDYTRTSYTYRATTDNPPVTLQQLIPHKVQELMGGSKVGRTVVLDIEDVDPLPGHGTIALPSRISAVRFMVGEPASWADPQSTDHFLRYELSYLPVQRLQLRSYSHYITSEPPFAPDPDPTAGITPGYTDTAYFLSGLAISGTETTSQPGGIEYGFDYWTCQTGMDADEDQVPVACPLSSAPADAFDLPDDRSALADKKGILRRVQLPTGGELSYGYDRYYAQYHTLAGYALCTCETDSIDCDTPSGSFPTDMCSDEMCASSSSTSLGVSERILRDSPGGEIVERSVYSQKAGARLSLVSRLDLGQPESAVEYPTSSSTTTVDRYLRADGISGTTLQTRADRSVYEHSLGRSILDGATDPCFNEPGDLRVHLPLEGALIRERHYRGNAQEGAEPLRTTVYAYTVDNTSASDFSGGGHQLQTDFNRRVRAQITYFHDDQTALMTRYGYESDVCLGGCAPYLASNRTLLVEQTEHLQGAFPSADDPYLHIRTAPTLGTDRRTVTSYWDSAEWIQGKPSSIEVSRGTSTSSTLESRQRLEYDAATGVVTRSIADDLGVGEDHVVTQYEYGVTSSGYWHGKVIVEQVGIEHEMDDVWTDSTPDSSRLIERGVTVDPQTQAETYWERVWSLCLADSQCPGWAQTGPSWWQRRAELVSESQVNMAWRRPDSLVDGNGDGIALIEYDTVGRKTSLTPTSSYDPSSPADPFVARTWIEYPSTNQTRVLIQDDPADTSIADGLLVAEYDFDGAGRLAHVRQRLPSPSGHAGNETFRHKRFSYDGTGAAWRETDWLASDATSPATLTPLLDPFGRPEQVERSDGSSTLTFYSGARRVETILLDTDGATVLRRTIRESDGAGNTVRVLENQSIDCPSPTTCQGDEASSDDFVRSNYAYDTADRLIEVVVTGRSTPANDVDQVRSFTYSSVGFLESETHPEHSGLVTTYSDHDALGNPGETTLPNGDILSSTFDAAGRLVKTTISLDGGLSEWDYSLMSYGVDPALHEVGRVVQTTQYNWLEPPVQGDLGTNPVVVTHDYDYTGTAQGLLRSRDTTITTPGSGIDHDVAFRVGYSYDMWANLSELEYPTTVGSTGCLPSPDLEVRYTWDPSGLLGIDQLIAGTPAVSLMSDVAYDTATGMLTQWTTPAGATGGLSSITHHVTPDGTRARPAAIHVDSSTRPSIVDLGSYAYDGAGNITDLGPWTYAYDNLSRLTSADSGSLGLGSRSYSYDDFGNLTNLGGRVLTADPSTNRLDGTGYRYDTLGNLIEIPGASGSTRHYRFDSANRMVAAWHSTDPDEYGFAYDSAGERVVRYRVTSNLLQEARFSIRDEAANVLTQVDWIPQHLPEDPAFGYWQTPVNHVYNGRNSILRIDPQAGEAFDADYTTLLRDHLGSMRAELVDGGAVDPVQYWPYGEIAANGSMVGERFLFTGHEREYSGETEGPLKDLYYLRARHYGPQNTGRFLSVDPIKGSIGISSTWNRYAYVRGNPVNRVDPSGMADRRTDEDKALTNDEDVMEAVVEIIDKMKEDGNEWGTQIIRNGDSDYKTEGVFSSGEKSEIKFRFRQDPETGEIRSEGNKELAAVMHGHPKATGLKDPFKKTSGPNRVLGTEGSRADGKVAEVTGKPNYVVVKDKMLLRVEMSSDGRVVTKKILTKDDFKAYVHAARSR